MILLFPQITVEQLIGATSCISIYTVLFDTPEAKMLGVARSVYRIIAH